MNSENLRLFICYSIYNSILRDEHGSIKTILTVCLDEKNAILQANPVNSVNTLNQRTEVVSKCQHKSKYKPKNHQPNETTFNTNWLITGT